MYCNRCGYKLNENDVVCKKCGNIIEQEKIGDLNNLYNTGVDELNRNDNKEMINQHTKISNSLVNNYSGSETNINPSAIVKKRKKKYWLIPILVFFCSLVALMISIIINAITTANGTGNTFTKMLCQVLSILFFLGNLSIIPSIVVAIILSNKNSNSNNEINMNINNFQNSEEKMIAAYIGNNYEKITTKKFNFAAWFFNIGYLFYRKMYIQGIILYLIMGVIIAISNETIFTCIFVFADIVFGFIFKRWYMNNVKKQIKLIRKNNPNSSEEKLIDICKNKGGTNLILSIIILIILSTITSTISSHVGMINDEIGDKENGYILEYTIPSSYTLVLPYANDNNTKVYYTKDSVKSCEVSIRYEDNSFYDSSYDYLKSRYCDDLKACDIGYNDINSNIWYFMNTENYLGNKEYTYVHGDGKKMYEVVFEYKDYDESSCSNDYVKILKSLKFIEN